jgi:hypothetical protein
MRPGSGVKSVSYSKNRSRSAASNFLILVLTSTTRVWRRDRSRTRADLPLTEGAPARQEWLNMLSDHLDLR